MHESEANTKRNTNGTPIAQYQLKIIGHDTYPNQKNKITFTQHKKGPIYESSIEKKKKNNNGPFF